MRLTAQIVALTAFGILALIGCPVFAEAPSESQSELDKFFAILLDSSSTRASVTTKRRMLAGFKSGTYEENSPSLKLGANDLRSDDAFTQMGLVAASAEVPSAITSEASRILGSISDRRALEALKGVVESKAPDEKRIDAVEGVAVRMAADFVDAADYLDEVANSSSDERIKTAAARQIARFKQATFPILVLFHFARSGSDHIKLAAKEALDHRHASDDRLEELDLIAIASVRESRDKLFDEAITAQERAIVEHRKELAKSRSKKSSMDGWFALVMDKFPTDPVRGLQQAQKEITYYRNESNRLMKLDPFDYAVELFASVNHMKLVSENLKKRSKYVTERARRAEEMADSLENNERVRIDYPDGTSEEYSPFDGNILPRLMVFAASKGIQAQAEAQARDAAKHLAMLQADLNRLSRDGLKKVKLAHVERMTEKEKSQGAKGAKSKASNPAGGSKPAHQGAKSEMAMARLYLEAKNESQAVSVLGGIVRLYPDSEEAAAARKLLLERGIELDENGKQIPPANGSK